MLRHRLARPSWLYRALIVGGVVGAARSLRPLPAGDFVYRAVHDTLLFILVPGTLALAHDRNLDWNADHAAPRNTLLFALFIPPFYLIGSSPPSIWAYYPI